jgi:hypothetical protein|nr:hypothetical protein [Acutalibacter muris]
MAKKKSFVTGPALYEDPALSFISRGELQPQEEPAGPLGVPEGYRPAYVERRSRRVQLVLPPSLYGRVKQASQGEGLSLNEFCCRALEQALEQGRGKG